MVQTKPLYSGLVCGQLRAIIFSKFLAVGCWHWECEEAAGWMRDLSLFECEIFEKHTDTHRWWRKLESPVVRLAYPLLKSDKYIQIGFKLIVRIFTLVESDWLQNGKYLDHCTEVSFWKAQHSMKSQIKANMYSSQFCISNESQTGLKDRSSDHSNKFFNSQVCRYSLLHWQLLLSTFLIWAY